MSPDSTRPAVIETDIPSRLDALPWGRFHTLVVVGTLIGTGERELIAMGYAFGATLMVGASIVAWKLGVKAERTSLERVAEPLSCVSSRA